MRLRARSGSWGLLVAGVAMLTILPAAGCSDLLDTGTTAGGDTATTEVITSLPAAVTTTGGDEVTTTTTTLAPTTTAAPASTTTTEALSSAETRLPDGHIKALGFIKNVWVDGSGRHLKIDYVDLITGEAEATAAAIADGLILPGETWDAEFYISNHNPLLRTFSISDPVEIYTQFRNHLVDLDGVPCSWADFLNFWTETDPGCLPEGDRHLPTSLWWIERDGDTVVWTMQMFTP